MNTKLGLRKIFAGTAGLIAVAAFLPIHAVESSSASPQHPCTPTNQTAAALESPLVPGLPCPPTATPSSGSGQESTVQGELVRFTMVNQSGRIASLMLQNSSATYIFNTNPGETREFTPQRGVYTYELVACGIVSVGYFEVSRQQTYIVPACSTDKLVRVYIENTTSDLIVVELSGPQDYYLPVLAGGLKDYTVVAGDYEFSYSACGAAGQGFFEARSDRLLSLDCP